MNTWLIADTHFNHKNILTFEQNGRDFTTIEDMNETIIYNWNNVIWPDDKVYMLGDFFMGQLDDIPPILSRLHGQITLIRGNHDQKNRIKVFQDFGIEVKDREDIWFDNKLFILTHYPTITSNGKDSEHIWNLHGHTHQKTIFSEYPHCVHVGVDAWEMGPVNIETINILLG